MDEIRHHVFGYFNDTILYGFSVHRLNPAISQEPGLVCDKSWLQKLNFGCTFKYLCNTNSFNMNAVIENLLNDQVKYEASASMQYLAMASWADDNGYNGVAEFYYAQSEVERGHMT